MLTEFVDTVTVEKDNIFLWGLWLRNKPTYFRMTTEGRGKKMTARCEEGETSPKSNAPPPKWGKNGRLLSAGCSRDRRTSKIRESKNCVYLVFSQIRIKTKIELILTRDKLYFCWKGIKYIGESAVIIYIHKI